MGLFSSLRKDKQESASDDSDFYSRAEENTDTASAKRRRSRKAENKEAIDPVLPEKKRARRRLIGAIALVLAAIIGLPMIFDSEPKPLASDIAIQIPSRDAPLARNADRSAKAAVIPDAENGAPEIDEEARVQPTQSLTSPPEKLAPKESSAPSSTAKPATPKAAVETEPQPESLLKTAPPKVAEKGDSSDRALAILSGKPDALATKAVAQRERKADKFVVQVAALASRDKVVELQEKLKKAGIKSYTQKVATQSGDRIRIRIGPFATRDEADKVRARVSKLGLNGTLIPV